MNSFGRYVFGYHLLSIEYSLPMDLKVAPGQDKKAAVTGRLGFLLYHTSG
jgi:hypothetical protein